MVVRSERRGRWHAVFQRYAEEDFLRQHGSFELLPYAALGSAQEPEEGLLFILLSD